MIKDIEGRMVVIHDDTERDNFLFIMEDEGYKESSKKSIKNS